MTVKINPLANLTRPSLLVGAVRFGLASYNREAILSRVVGESVHRAGHRLVAHLSEIESDCESRRVAGAPDYSVPQHVDALTALVAESRAWDAAAAGNVTPIRPDQENESGISALRRAT